MKCSAYKDIEINYIEKLKVNNLDNLFEEKKIIRVANFLITRYKIQNAKEKRNLDVI